MTNMKKIRVGLGIILFLFIAYMSFYKFRYSMNPITTYEVNSPDLPVKILIATQGSPYKDTLVKELIIALKEKAVFIKVIDISELPNVKVTEWNAFVLIHTWEMWRPPPVIKTFLDEYYSKEKMIVITTSDDGNYKMKKVDAITGASVMENIPERIEKITDRLDEVVFNSIDS